MDTEEDRRKKALLSMRVKVVVGVYLFGCALMYFGVPVSLMEFCQTREWTYQPEKDIIPALFEAAIELVRPFLAVFVSIWSALFALVTTWYLSVPIGILLLVFRWSDGLIRFFRTLINRDD